MQPFRWKNGHTFHGGTEYTFHLEGDRKVRAGLGVAFDKAVTRTTNPNPVTAPPQNYLGVSGGLQYDLPQHVFGIAGNWGKYSKTVTALDPTLIPFTTFTGLYGIEVFELQRA